MINLLQTVYVHKYNSVDHICCYKYKNDAEHIKLSVLNENLF